LTSLSPKLLLKGIWTVVIDSSTLRPTFMAFPISVYMFTSELRLIRFTLDDKIPVTSELSTALKVFTVLETKFRLQQAQLFTQSEL
jgi:hypothetical protein